MGIIAFSEGCGLLLDVSQNNVDGLQRQMQFLKLSEAKIASSVKSSGAIFPRQYFFWVRQGQNRVDEKSKVLVFIEH